MVLVLQGNCSFCDVDDCIGCSCATVDGKPRYIEVDDEPRMNYLGSADWDIE